MGRRHRYLVKPSPTAAMGSATFALALALVASWVLADEAAPGGPITATTSDDGLALVVSGGLPSEELRDDLFEILAAETGVSVIVSEVMIVATDEPPPSIDSLAQTLLADLG